MCFSAARPFGKDTMTIFEDLQIGASVRSILPDGLAFLADVRCIGTLSGWKTGLRCPGKTRRKRFLNLAAEAGIRAPFVPSFRGPERER